MRSSHWEYLGYVLTALGSALVVTGLITFYYFQGQRRTNPQYSAYPIPLIILGICIIVLGIVASLRSRQKKKHETSRPEMLPPPPPP